MKLNLAKIKQQVASKKPTAAKPAASRQQPVASNPVPKQKLDLLDPLTTQYAKLKKERAILSTRTAQLIEEVRQKLHAESPALATEFMAGKLPMPEIAAHYAAILEHTQKMTDLWDKIRYVQENGALPVESVHVTVINSPTVDVSAITAEIRRLDDLIHKTYKKLQTGKPKNADRVHEWKSKIAMAEATRDELKRKRKNLQYGARAQRLGSE